MNSALEAHYSMTSRWELPFGLTFVADWYVKRDTLYVKFNTSDREFAEFEPNVSACEFDEPYDHPTAVEHWQE